MSPSDIHAVELERKKKRPHMYIEMISVMNQSSFISDASVAKIVSAIGRQLAADVAPEHGSVPALEFVPKGEQPTNDSMPCYIIDEPDVEGALGYHDIDAHGKPFIKIFCQPIYDNGGTDYLGANSVSVTLSHEILELVGDEAANAWCDAPDGSDYARELCDAVEGDCYDVELEDGTKVSVSDFVYKAFFNPKIGRDSGVRLNHKKTLTAPFQTAIGGYQIRRTEPGQVGQVFGRTRGSIPIDGGVVLVFGDAFPSWKRPFKMRKAYKRAATKPHYKPRPTDGRKPPPFGGAPQPPIKSPIPAKTFGGGRQPLPHKPPALASSYTPNVPKQLPEWLKKIAVQPTTKRDEAESLLAGSGSHKYDEPGTTDWLDEGRPDYESREDAPTRPTLPEEVKPAKQTKPLPTWLAKIAVGKGE